MAGDDDLERVVVQRVPDSAFCVRVPDGFGDLLVRPRLAVGNLAGGLEDAYLEFGTVDGDGDGEFGNLPGEVLVQFLDDIVVGFRGGTLQRDVGIGCRVGAGLDRTRDNRRFARARKAQPAEGVPFEREGPFAPHVAVLDGLDVFLRFSHA